MDPIRLFNEEDYEFHLTEFKSLKMGGKCRLNEDDFDDLIDFFQFQGDRDNTREAYHYATTLFPYSSMLLQKKIEWLLSHNKTGQALKLAEQLRIMDPNGIQSTLLYAGILIESEQVARAIILLEETLVNSTGHEKSMLVMELSELYYEVGSYNKGLEIILALLQEQPLNEHALESVPFWSKENKEEKNVSHFLEGLLNEHPLHAYAWNRLGLVYKFQKDYANAIEAYENCIALDSTDEEAHGYLARCYIKLKKYDEAIDVLKDFQSFANPINGIFDKLGYCYEMKEDYLKARNYYRRSLKIKPEQHKLYIKIGNTYMIEEQWEKAVKSFSLAFQIKPESLSASVSLGKALLQVEAYEEAMTSFLHATEQKAKHKTNQLLLIKSLFLLNYWNEALVQINVAEDKCGSKVEFAYYRAGIYLAMGKLQEASVHLENALEIDSDKMYCLNDLDEGILKHPYFAPILVNYI